MKVSLNRLSSFFNGCRYWLGFVSFRFVGILFFFAGWLVMILWRVIAVSTGSSFRSMLALLLVQFPSMLLITSS